MFFLSSGVTLEFCAFLLLLFLILCHKQNLGGGEEDGALRLSSFE